METQILTPPLDLPPLYQEVALREGGDAFAQGCAIAPHAGAGTLVWSRSYRRFDVAVVLEPDRPVGSARLALYAGMVALADMLAVHAPPETPLAFVWPDRIEIDGAAAGGVRLALPPSAEHDVPAWLVLHAGLRVAFDEGVEPGSLPQVTSLLEQGFEPVEVGRLVESYARHLMAWLHDWQERGPRPLAEAYLARLAKPQAAKRGLDPATGDLILHDDAGREERLSLAALLASPSWLAAAGVDE